MLLFPRCQHKLNFLLSNVLFLLSQIKFDFLQIQKINLVCEGTLEILRLEAADINDKGQLLARTFVNDGSF